MKSILIIEDDKNIRDSLFDYLKREGFAVASASSLHEARARLKPPPDLMILDWILPDGQGVDFLKERRAEGCRIPIIMLTARAELVDKVVGLESGADDYLVKPFEPRELVARIRVRLRNQGGTGGTDGGGLEAAGITVNRVTREVVFRGAKVELRKMEYDLLLLFLENPNKAFSREEILNKVWGYDSFPTTRTVDTHILQLRQKFDETLFETVRGIGYRLKAK